MGTTWTDLQQLVDPNTPYFVLDAININNAGDIIAVGGILTPNGFEYPGILLIPE